MKKYPTIFLALFLTTVLAVALAGCNSIMAKDTNNGSSGSNSGLGVGKNSPAGGPDSDGPGSNSQRSAPGKPITLNQNTNNNGRGNNSLPPKGNRDASSSGLPIIEDGFSKHPGKPPKGALLENDENEGSGSGEATKPGKLRRLLSLRITEASESTESSKSATSKRHAIQGMISSLLGDLMTLSHQIHRDRVTDILISGAQIFQPKNSPESSSSGSLQVGQRVIVFGEINSSGQMVAKRIRIIPGKANGVFNKNPLSSPSSTPSATPLATSSAEPTDTPNPTEAPTETPTAAPTATP
jgi:hypothetical protein